MDWKTRHRARAGGYAVHEGGRTFPFRLFPRGQRLDELFPDDVRVALRSLGVRGGNWAVGFVERGRTKYAVHSDNLDLTVVPDRDKAMRLRGASQVEVVATWAFTYSGARNLFVEPYKQPTT